MTNMVQDVAHLIFTFFFFYSEIMANVNRSYAIDTSAETDFGVPEQCDSDSSVNSKGNKITILLIISLVLDLWFIGVFKNSLLVLILDHTFHMTIVLTGNSSAIQFGNENILLWEKLKIQKYPGLFLYRERYQNVMSWCSILLTCMRLNL